MNDYTWNDHKLLANKSTPAQIEANIIGDETKREVRIEIVWGLPGVRGQESVAKWIPQRMKTAVDILKKGNWDIELAENKWANIRIEAAINIEKIIPDLEKVVLIVQEATGTLRF